MRGWKWILLQVSLEMITVQATPWETLTYKREKSPAQVPGPKEPWDTTCVLP